MRFKEKGEVNLLINLMNDDFPILQIVDLNESKLISGDVVCILNDDVNAVNRWLFSHEVETQISYKGQKFKGAVEYPKVYVFNSGKAMNGFMNQINLIKQDLQGFELQSVLNALASTYNRIRYINEISLDSFEGVNKNLCFFVDIKTFNKKYVELSEKQKAFFEVNNCEFVISFKDETSMEKCFTSREIKL